MNKTGRPTSLTRELIERFTEMRLHGVRFEAAARACDVSDNSVRNWLKRGELADKRIETEGEPVKPSPASKQELVEYRAALKAWKEWLAAEELFLHFFHTHRTVLGQREERLILIVNMAALDPKNWRAALELLRIEFGREHEDYNPKTRIDSNTTVSGSLAVTNPESRTPAELKALIAGKQADAYLLGYNDASAVEEEVES